MNAKHLLRKNVAQFLFKLGFTTPKRCSTGRLTIVTFHRVLPQIELQAYPFPGLAVTPEELDEFLTYFTQHFNCGTLAAQHEQYVSRKKTVLPLLAITFDDAQLDNYKYAAPILAKHNVKASFFAPVSAIKEKQLLWHDKLGFAILTLSNQSGNGQTRLMQILDEAGLAINKLSESLVSDIVMASKTLSLNARLRLVSLLTEASSETSTPEFARLMSFEELATLAANGHEIGSHSMTHCMMPECDDPSLMYELNESRQVLQAQVNQPIDSFCYPNGNADVRTALAVQNAGYHRAVTTDWGSNELKTDPFRLDRYDIVSRHIQDFNGVFIPALLAFRMSGYYPGLG